MSLIFGRKYANEMPVYHIFYKRTCWLLVVTVEVGNNAKEPGRSFSHDTKNPLKDYPNHTVCARRLKTTLKEIKQFKFKTDLSTTWVFCKQFDVFKAIHVPCNYAHIKQQLKYR